MKERILITTAGLRVGGVERSLLGLLGALDRERYEITLHLWAHDGELMEGIPKDIYLLPENIRYASLERPIKEVLFGSAFPVAIARLAAKFISHVRTLLLRKNGFLLLRSVRYSLPFLPAIEGRYDLGISFLTPHDPLLNKVTATKKIGWIHTDYSTMECGVDHGFEQPMWKALNHIVAVSEDVRSTFLKVFPYLDGQVSTIENIISPELVWEEAMAHDVSGEMPHTDGVTNICSVGRFCYAKNFDAIPEIVMRLNQIGIRVRWYLIGFGSDEALVKELIIEKGVQDKVIILGMKTNPYPYIKACNIYVQPSRFEGKAVAVREAQILGKPVLITNYPTANSQLEDGEDGMICPLSVDGVVDGISKLINEKGLRDKLASTAAGRDYSNRAEVENIYQLMQ